MTVTIKDIAKICDVSYATVSRALNNHPRINVKTREKVARIAQSLGYIPNGLARSLVTRKSNTIALIIPDISNIFWAEVVKGAQDIANEADFQLLLCNTNQNESREILYIENILERQVDGLIIASHGRNTANWIKTIDLPFVFLEMGSNYQTESSIIFDNRLAMHLAVDHLVELGHRCIAYVFCSSGMSSHNDRFQAFIERLEHHNIKLDPRLLINALHSTIEEGYHCANQLLSANTEQRPTAIIAYNDLLAIGVLQAASEIGINVPSMLSVIGIDDIKLSHLPRIALTTIRQPQYEIGSNAVKILIEKIEKATSGNTKPLLIIPELVSRSTCAPPCS